MTGIRAHERYAVEIDAEITIGTEVVPARTSNLSKGGMCVIAPRPLAAGEMATVALSLVFDEGGVSEALALQARIVWSTRVSPGPHQVGVMFMNMNGEQRAYLDLFLKYLNR